MLWPPFDAVIAEVLPDGDGSALVRLDLPAGAPVLVGRWHFSVVNAPAHFDAAVGTLLCFRGREIYVRGRLWARRGEGVNLRLVPQGG